MKIFNGVISVVLGFISLYLMFFKAHSNLEFVCGFAVLLMAIIFMCFMIMSEQEDELVELRYRMLNANKSK